MNNKNKMTLGIFISIIVLILLTGLTYAYFSANITGEEESTTITVTGGVMNIFYDGGADIKVQGIIPSDIPFATKTFTVTGNNTTDLEMYYEINLIIEQNTFTEDALKYKLVSTNTNNNGEVIPSINDFANIVGGYQNIYLGTGFFSSPTNGNKVHTYNLELYFPETGVNQSEDQGKEIKAYIEIREGKKIPIYNKEKGVNHPVLFTGMTPVIWNGSEFIHTNEEDPSWYDYETKKWANAVSKDGSYWVWIPRYAYKITSGYHTSETGSIDVKFLKGYSNETSDQTKIEYRGYDSVNKNTSDNYFVHPAFKFNGEELGFWVAKYEPSVSDINSACYNEPSEINCNTDTHILKSIPNAPTWRFIQVYNSFNLSLNMKNKTDIYGWKANELDTHMMKNTEWGAIAYLSISKYGAHTEEIWNNSFTGYRTGCSGTNVNAAIESVCIEYNTLNGQKASTTHNIYGVYDMSGGARDNVMANYNNVPANSGFTTEELISIESKYIDRYTTLSENMLDEIAMNYDLIKYGDAFYETSYNPFSLGEGNRLGSWYNDLSYMPSITDPWIHRGGPYHNAESAGIFDYDDHTGNTSTNSSFRTVLFSVRPS